MDTAKSKVKWNEQKSRIKGQLTKLTNNKMLFEVGRKKEILRKLAKAVGKSKEEVARILDGL